MNTNKEIYLAINILVNEYPFIKNEIKKHNINFLKTSLVNSCSKISRENNSTLIEYSTIPSALRAILQIIACKNLKNKVIENSNFKTLGVMLDCSRNAVPKVSYLKKWLNHMALMGYNALMLYTEDTYEIPGEEYFGYLRGAYTTDELKEINSHANHLGIEMIGCIQTLGHAEQILKWPVYQSISDTYNIFLAENQNTYELIEKMVKTFAKVYQSKRIHLGMDEAIGLGAGQYKNINSKNNPWHIFAKHLDKIIEICQKYDLKPMIWSDMFFRMASKENDYYDKNIDLSNIQGISKDVQLVYWDYYHKDKTFYLDWISKHKTLGYKPIMASAIWSWLQFWYDSKLTNDTLAPCISASKESNLSDFFITIWGDDGAYFDYDSTLHGLFDASNIIFQQENSTALAPQMFNLICGTNYDYIKNITQNLNFIKKYEAKPELKHDCLFDQILATSIFWDDPLLGILWNNEKLKNQYVWGEVKDHYENILNLVSEKFKSYEEDFINNIIWFLYKKIDLKLQIEQVYQSKNFESITTLLSEIKNIIPLIYKIDASFTKQWHKKNKPFGLEIMQGRFSGLARRYIELYERLESLTKDHNIKIEEFENLLKTPVKGNPYYKYNQLCTSSMLYF